MNTVSLRTRVVVNNLTSRLTKGFLKFEDAHFVANGVGRMIKRVFPSYQVGGLRDIVKLNTSLEDGRAYHQRNIDAYRLLADGRVGEFNSWIAKEPYPFINLSFADLSGGNLTGVNLSSANLFRADLSRTNLDSANLSGADLGETLLCGTVLVRATLKRAVLDDAQVINTIFSNADLQGARFYRSHIKDASFRDADLTGAAFSGKAASSGSVFSGKNVFNGAKVEGIHLGGSSTIGPAKQILIGLPAEMLERVTELTDSFLACSDYP